MKPADRRNLNPTAEAVIAMNLFPDRYCTQSGGSMDFWDKLSDRDKRRCVEVVELVRSADKTHKVQRR